MLASGKGALEWFPLTVEPELAIFTQAFVRGCVGAFLALDEHDYLDSRPVVQHVKDLF